MEESEVFNNSYSRLFGRKSSLNVSDEFFDYFYWHLINSSVKIEKAFADTDMEWQKNMLKKSLVYAVNFSCAGQDVSYMRDIAKKHSKSDKDIDPQLYDLWADSMLAAVEKFDEFYDEDVDLAWRLALSHVITYMKYMHGKIA